MMTKSQAAAAVAAGVYCEVFHHSERGRFNVTAMRQMVLYIRPNDFELVRTPITKEIVEFLRANREICNQRITELSPTQLAESPIFVLCRDGTHLPIDGNHRICRLWRDGVRWMSYYEVPISDAIFVTGDCWVDLPWGDMEMHDGRLQKRV